MPATKEQVQRSIAPGSTEFGDRQQMESNLAAAMPSQTGGAPGRGPSGPPPAGGGGDPMQALLGGLGQSPLPVTSGLSVGPGSGPQDLSPEVNDKVAKLRMMVSQAKTPLLRHMAKQELLRMARAGEL